MTDKEQQEQIEIPLSRKKMVLSLLGAIMFVVIGFWFIIYRDQIDTPILGDPILISIIGVISILLFGLISILLFRKLFDKEAGLIINQQGIVDNSSGVSAGVILWSNIKEIKVTQVMSQKFIMIIIDNPQEYIDKVSNSLRRRNIEINYKSYGSPINISSNALKIGFDDLHQLLTDKMKEYRS